LKALASQRRKLGAEQFRAGFLNTEAPGSVRGVRHLDGRALELELRSVGKRDHRRGFPRDLPFVELGQLASAL
jgi:hypothetical protein